MKTIITNGKYNQVTCAKCGCVYTFEKIDLTEDKKVICPQCDAVNTPSIKPEN